MQTLPRIMLGAAAVLIAPAMTATALAAGQAAASDSRITAVEQQLRDVREQLDQMRRQQLQQRKQELLDNPSSMKRVIVKEIESDAKQYGDERRTLIETAERAVIEAKVPDEPVTVIASQKGWLRARQGHGHDAAQFVFKQGDEIYGAFECRTTDTLVALADNGRVFSVAVAGLPSARGDGQPVTAMIDLEAGTRIVHMIAAAPDTRKSSFGTRFTSFERSGRGVRAMV